MCTTNGTGEAVRRGFAGRRCGPPASSTSRSEPAMAGTTTRATRAKGTHPIDRLDRVDRVVQAAAWMLTWRRSDRAVS